MIIITSRYFKIFKNKIRYTTHTPTNKSSNTALFVRSYEYGKKLFFAVDHIYLAQITISKIRNYSYMIYRFYEILHTK